MNPIKWLLSLEYIKDNYIQNRKKFIDYVIKNNISFDKPSDIYINYVKSDYINITKYINNDYTKVDESYKILIDLLLYSLENEKLSELIEVQKHILNNIELFNNNLPDVYLKNNIKINKIIDKIYLKDFTYTNKIDNDNKIARLIINDKYTILYNYYLQNSSLENKILSGFMLN